MCEHKKPDAYCSKSLFEAARDGMIDCVVHQVETGADVNTRDDKGLTALMHAAIGDHLKCVCALIDAGG